MDLNTLKITKQENKNFKFQEAATNKGKERTMLEGKMKKRKKEEIFIKEDNLNKKMNNKEEDLLLTRNG